MSATRDIDNTLFIPFMGMNEAVLDQQINPTEFTYLQGLVHDKVGQLRLLYSKRILFRQGNSSVLGIYPMGDFVLVETRESITRYSNQEFFDNGETQVPVLEPDVYPEGGGGSEEEEYALINYSAAQGVDGDLLAANVWTELNNNTWAVVSDPDSHVSFPGAGATFRVVAAAYPTTVNVKIVAVCGSESGAVSNPKLQARLRVDGGAAIAYSEVISTRQNDRENSCLATLQFSFSLAASTDYVLEMWTSTQVFAEASGIGTEVYATVKFIFVP
jgi:hypothetical protein